MLDLFFYIIVFVIVSTIVYSIIEFFSMDRVLKIVRGKKAHVALNNELHFGKLHIPPRSGGGFEVFYERIHNPESLVLFLEEKYKETKDNKFLNRKQEILKFFKIRIKGLKFNAWLNPTLSSRKIFQQELNKLKAIFIFRDYLSEKELEERKRELSKLLYPPFYKVIGRKISNALSFIKDKLTSSTSQFTSLAPLPTEMKKVVEESTKKVIVSKFSGYEPLLENSIGRVVNVEVIDLDGKKRIYSGILREYSNKYILLYDIHYKFQLVLEFKNNKTKVSLKNQPKVFGDVVEIGKHVEIKRKNNKIIIKNIHTSPIKIIKIKSGQKEVEINKVLEPNQFISLSLPKNFIMEYEVSKIADIIWPRSLARVLGFADIFT